MAAKRNIEIILTAKDTGLRRTLNQAQGTLTRFAVGAQGLASPFVSLTRAALNLKTVLASALAGAGVTAFSASLIRAASEAGTAFFNLKTSIKAANREFQVGAPKNWSKNVADLTKELQVYSTTAVQQAAAKTIDMTKRLGLNEQQMVKVIRAAANLGAGKFELSESVERVTAALRGEAEASEALGLTLSETYVKGWYEARGATQGAWKDLTDIEKAQVRYNVLLAQSNPLLGKAADSAKTYGGAVSVLTNAADKLQTSLGQVVTNNTFFVEALRAGGRILDELNGQVTTNRLAWMEWAKQSALGVLEFVASASTGFNDIYKSLSYLAGSLKLAWAGTATLASGFQFLFEQAARFAGLEQYAEYWAKAQADSARLVEEAMGGAVESFDNAERGSKTLETITTRVEQLKNELAQIKAVEIDPMAKVEQPAISSMENIGGKWTNVTGDMSKKGRDAAESMATDFSKSAQTLEAEYDSSINATIRKLEELQRAAARSAPAGYRAGGAVTRLARGGRLPGYGGGDRIPALLEAGEYVVRKEAVSRFGAGLFAALNSLRLPDLPRYASGGPVGAGVSGGMMTINLNFGPGRAATVQASPTDARTLARELARIERLRSA